MIQALKNRITSLENELEQVKVEVKKLEQTGQSGQLLPEELVDHKYQLYFREPQVPNDVIVIMKEIMAKAIDKKVLRQDQRFKVELVDDQNKAGWKAIRLTTKGCCGNAFRSLGKRRVCVEEDTDNLRTQQPLGSGLYQKVAKAPAVMDGAIYDFIN